jgi:hypothetical protein
MSLNVVVADVSVRERVVTLPDRCPACGGTLREAGMTAWEFQDPSRRGLGRGDHRLRRRLHGLADWGAKRSSGTCTLCAGAATSSPKARREASGQTLSLGGGERSSVTGCRGGRRP